MVNDTIKAIGNLEVKLLNSDGQEIDKREIKNMARIKFALEIIKPTYNSVQAP